MIDAEKTESPSDIAHRVTIKSDEFADLLKKIDSATGETCKLWREIYENAVDDRMHAYLLFVDLYRSVANSTDGHALHGKQIAQYIERMNKANDQLLKLAELLAAASSGDGDIDAEALYDEINEVQQGKNEKK